jgi:hypothetical protein
VERSGTPGIVGVEGGRVREVGDSRFIEQAAGLAYRALLAFPDHEVVIDKTNYETQILLNYPVVLYVAACCCSDHGQL